MPLRSLARKLGAPAIAALRRASSSRVSPAAGSGVRAFRSSQRGEGSRKAYRVTNAEVEAILKKMEKLKKGVRDYLETSRLIDNLPRNIALSAATGVLAGTSIVAYVLGAFE